uniref:Neurotransmitter-gated ion-channel ligand-binding domain-containing protein n=1 Tax=Meloidogyne javanica TaxID=6303 RepID=A0A915LHY1_MELJA
MHPLLENANNIGNAMTSTDQSSTDLLDFLFGGYDKRIRPFSDQQRPVIIEMTIVLAILTELRENQQVASFVISHIQ